MKQVMIRRSLSNSRSHLSEITRFLVRFVCHFSFTMCHHSTEWSSDVSMLLVRVRRHARVVRFQSRYTRTYRSLYFQMRTVRPNQVDSFFISIWLPNFTPIRLWWNGQAHACQAERRRREIKQKHAFYSFAQVIISIDGKVLSNHHLRPFVLWPRDGFLFRRRQVVASRPKFEHPEITFPSFRLRNIFFLTFVSTFAIVSEVCRLARPDVPTIFDTAHAETLCCTCYKQSTCWPSFVVSNWSLPCSVDRCTCPLCLSLPHLSLLASLYASYFVTLNFHLPSLARAVLGRLWNLHATTGTPILTVSMPFLTFTLALFRTASCHRLRPCLIYFHRSSFMISLQAQLMGNKVWLAYNIEIKTLHYFNTRIDTRFIPNYLAR